MYCELCFLYEGYVNAVLDSEIVLISGLHPLHVLVSDNKYHYAGINLTI
jgi:hypothetical protein